MPVMIFWFQETASRVQEGTSGAWLQYAVIVGPILSLITLGTILLFRYRDNRTHLKITYTVGEPEFLTDVNDIPESERPRHPALWIKIFNRGKMNARLNNVYFEISLGLITFEGLGTLMRGEAPTMLQERPPGGHWIGHQSMVELARLLREHGCGGTTRFKLVARDWSGNLHKKTVKIEDVEHWATFYGPQEEIDRPKQSWWQKRFGRC